MNNLLFFAALFIELTAVLIEGSDLILPAEGMLFRVTFILFLLSAVIGLIKRRKKGIRGMLLMLAPGGTGELCIYILAGILFTVSYFVTGRNELLRILVFVYAAANMDSSRINRSCLFVTAAGTLLIVLLSLSGIFGIQKLFQDFGSGPELRYCFGFGHPNALHCMAAMLLMLYFYIYGSVCGWYVYVILGIGNILLYTLTRSNSGFIIVMAAVILNAAARIFPKAGKPVYLAAEAVFAAELVFSYLAAAYGYSIPMLQKLDRFLTGRIASLYETNRQEGTVSTWSLFSAPRNVYYFDMGWVRLFYWYGIIPAAFCVGIVFWLYRRMRQENDLKGLVFLLCLCTYTVVEAHIISVFILRNLILLLIIRYEGASWRKNIESEN
ncbi:MAG: hypothetical protein J6P87_00510 [Lachnospiraceae bacterium]|nr:hypothetical protein [Lachnospiraceae bacterium]